VVPLVVQEEPLVEGESPMSPYQKLEKCELEENGSTLMYYKMIEVYFWSCQRYVAYIFDCAILNSANLCGKKYFI